jgi:hypothetical protein
VVDVKIFKDILGIRRTMMFPLLLDDSIDIYDAQGIKKFNLSYVKQKALAKDSHAS